MKTGFYIPCFNAGKYLEKVLDSVLSQTLKPEQVLVIDDGSTDNSLEIAGKYPVQIIRHETNKGLAAVRNTALKSLDAEYIACIDSDCVADKDWLRSLLEIFTADEIAGAGGSLVESCEKTVQDMWRKVHMPQSWGDHSHEPEFLFGANTVFRKKALVDAGGYDQRFRTNYEDVDICRRIKQKGYRIVYEPKAVVHHLKKDDLQSLLNSFWKWHCPYYAEKRFYDSAEDFKDKIKDNIGLANRFLQEDLSASRKPLAYIDFLLAFDHCIRDYMHFIQIGKADRPDLSLCGQWLSLLDLNFFYRFDRENKDLRTLLPGTNALLQNVFALVLILGRIIEDGAGPELSSCLYKDMVSCIAGNSDKQIYAQLQRLILRHKPWDDLLEKQHNNLDRVFLNTFSIEFNRWFNSLKHDQDNVLKVIADSALSAYPGVTEERSLLHG